jgi:hypothetical protein
MKKSRRESKSRRDYPLSILSITKLFESINLNFTPIAFWQLLGQLLQYHVQSLI